ncbi:MAG: hypothetical protein DHS20C15_32510 [Planctomycetota bacterium]|nr:MAG: hypothetical protein DHS20C15_32510 [Planctomycetota bacterium]
MSENAQTIPERDHKTRSLAVPCPQCAHFEEFTLADAPRDLGPSHNTLPTALRCSQCDTSIPLALAAHVDPSGVLDGCPACEYHTLCIQKDMNPRFGVILVTVTFGALLFSGLPIPQMLMALVGLAVLDFALLRFVVRRLLICYRCKAQFRGFPPGPHCRPFDLSTWEAHDPPAEA